MKDTSTIYTTQCHKTMHQLLKRNNEFWNHERSLTALLVYMGSAIFIWISLQGFNQYWAAFVSGELLFSLIILAGIFAVQARWRRQLVFIGSGILASVLRLICFVHTSLFIEVFSYGVTTLFLFLLARLVLSHIFKEGPMNFYRIQGSIVVFLILGIIYAMVYTVVELLSIGSFVSQTSTTLHGARYPQLLYFSFTTMSTLGIGDIIPNSPFAKALVVFQGMLGLLYPVVMIARLVSMEVSYTMRK
ncbi:MAG: potassium channel family protein [Chryseolinea sp.]